MLAVVQLKQSLSLVPQSDEPENKFPDCLYMQLQGFPVRPKGLLDRILQLRPGAATKQVNLQLTIQFSEQWVPLPSGRFKFGLKAGELKLKLENGEIIWTPSGLGGSFDQKESQIRAGSEGGAEATDESGGATVRTETPGGTGNSIQVVTKGSVENPAWVFQAGSQPVLQGLIQNAKLGTLNVSARPCRVAATFEVSLQDMRLTDAEGLWPPDISSNKRAVLDRAIMHLLKSRLTPYLSRAELYYD